MDTLSDESKIKTDTALQGTNDIKERIACALSTKTDTIKIGRWQHNRSKHVLFCSGKWKGKSFFAKILLADLFSIPAPFKTPWEASHLSFRPTRTVGELIETQWNMTIKMHSLSGSHSVPVPLGKSLAARTIVWEEAGGISLNRALKCSRWKSSVPKIGEKALFQAGAWLKKIHEASYQGKKLLEAPALIQSASGLAWQEEGPARHYKRIASGILEAMLTEMGEPGTLEVPVGFTHGDFCLSNLLWETTGRQLAVIDFELSGLRPVYYDLFAMIADLRAKLLNPLIPKSAIQSWEQSFWQGYGPISVQLKTFVRGLALASVFYERFPRLLMRRERKGYISGLNARLYRTILEDTMISRRLGIRPDFVRYNHE